ncbi:hypothetical protein [Gabonibacter chumensis]|uniref:hypothetical protein n=1 Tax=Gabonibacter chumensis TaxID=2972474 RepID=UPI00257311CF|nr:hypothetical protein [Gabonibacter chumensis]MCR9011465.1 hypothetical protein [Gabonibacter chumensis]
MTRFLILTITVVCIGITIAWNNKAHGVLQQNTPMKNIELKFIIQESSEIPLHHDIIIYDGDPSRNGHVLTKGKATTKKPFVTSIRVSAQKHELFSVSRIPFHSKQITRTVKQIKP